MEPKTSSEAASDDAAEIVVELSVEGGGQTVYRRPVGNDWVFWSEGSSMDMDENDKEHWREWRQNETPNLEEALPEIWPWMSPKNLHPEHRGWFLNAFQGWSNQHPSSGHHDKWCRMRWRKVLGLEGKGE